MRRKNSHCICMCWKFHELFVHPWCHITSLYHTDFTLECSFSYTLQCPDTVFQTQWVLAVEPCQSALELLLNRHFKLNPKRWNCQQARSFFTVWDVLFGGWEQQSGHRFPEALDHVKYVINDMKRLTSVSKMVTKVCKYRWCILLWQLIGIFSVL